MAPPLRAAEDGITPVIGTVLVLAITVTGIGVALFLGAPTIERMQQKAALETVVGQFSEVRGAVQSMQVTGTVRTPAIALPDGVVSLGPGTALTVTVQTDPPLPETPETHVYTTSSNALSWEGTQVSAVYELGGILAHERGATHVVAMPRVGEGSEDFYFHNPVLTGESAAFSGDGDHAVALELVGTFSETVANVESVTFTFSGERAQLWCEAWRIRNTLVPLTPTQYTAPTPCTSVTFDPPALITFHYTQATYSARLQV